MGHCLNCCLTESFMCSLLLFMFSVALSFTLLVCSLLQGWTHGINLFVSASGFSDCTGQCNKFIFEWKNKCMRRCRAICITKSRIDTLSVTLTLKSLEGLKVMWILAMIFPWKRRLASVYLISEILETSVSGGSEPVQSLSK